MSNRRSKDSEMAKAAGAARSDAIQPVASSMSGTAGMGDFHMAIPRKAYATQLHMLHVKPITPQRRFVQRMGRIPLGPKNHASAPRFGSTTRIVEYLGASKRRAAALAKLSERECSAWHFRRDEPYLPLVEKRSRLTASPTEIATDGTLS